MQLVQLSDTARDRICENHLPSGMRVWGNYQRLLQVFVNLLNNAIQASLPGDRVRVRGEFRGEFVEIQVEDEGGGIPESLLDRVFEPFFTTKPPGEGTGLGLSVVYSIIQDHGGAVYVENLPDGGTRFTLRLPMDDSEPAREPQEITAT